MHEWLVFSLILLGIWFVVFRFRPFVRKEMFWVSLFTMPFGLTQPLFVPAYWTPPSLFNLAAKTGFDFESLIFSFAVGGIASVLYKAIFRVVGSQKMIEKNIDIKRRRFHKLAMISPVIVFVPLFLLTKLNPIYLTAIAMTVGGVLSMVCRPDLKKQIVIGGLLFAGLYFMFFLSINLIFPTFVNSWNLSALTGIIILGVPLEELMFAFTFGMMWSSIHEHGPWHKIIDFT